MSDLTFHGVWRMDWGFGNPNKTAAFVAILMVAVWLIAYFRRWGFWVALAVFIGLGITLVHTMSRGGIIALVAGMLPLLIWAPRPFRRSHLIGTIVGFWVIVGASIYLKATERYVQGVAVEDRSISNRFQLWKEAPAMIADSPSGWGIGNSGNAYIQWYQPLDRNETYRTLVNSHLTWLVEFNWPLRCLYLFGWASIFLLCWPLVSCRWRAIALGTWVCLFVSSFFSSVGENWIMWIVPGALLLAVVVQRIAAIQFPRARQWAIPLGATILVSMSLLVMGRSATIISGSQEKVCFGSKSPDVWVFYDATTMGSLYGKNIRSAYNSTKFNHSIGILLKPISFPNLAGKTLILGGSLPNCNPSVLSTAIHECRELILINPKFSPKEIGVDPKIKAKMHTYFGDFCQSPMADEWKSLSNSEQISGAGDFLPQWPALIFNHIAGNDVH